MGLCTVNAPLLIRLLTTAGILLAVVLFVPSMGKADGTGFQATLNNPPSVVSFFDAARWSFLKAEPLAIEVPPLSPYLNRAIKPTGSNFEGNYITFNTEYYPGEFLVPVSVDAEQYMNYRLDRQRRDGFRNLGDLSLIRQKSVADKAGLNIGVALPQKLNRMFGEGGGNLRVSGYRRISFSGRSQWTDGVRSDVTGQSRFPSLNMDQVYRFDIEGTIGTKISVAVSEDSQTDIPLSNRILLRYKGDADDIIKTIEAGNTNLSLPNTRFVGYSSRIQGLFGLKAEAQLGAFRMTGIVSQEKGSSERASISATGEENANRIRDYQFAENRIFDLFYASEDIGPNDQVIDIHVYEGGRNLQIADQVKALDAVLLVDPANPGDPANEASRETPKVEEIDRTLYSFYDDPNGNKHYIVFNNRRDYALGVWMRVERRNANGSIRDTLTVGDLSSKPIVLKMIRPSQSYVPAHRTWPLMWRNVYDIPQGATPSDLDIRILKGAAGTEGTSSALEDQRISDRSQGKYIRLLGLDQYSLNGNKKPDEIVDERLEVFRSDWGLLIFPHRQPFDSDTTFEDADGTKSEPLDTRVPSIYNYSSQSERAAKSEYYIEYSSRSRSSIIRLNRANIIEGSERVTVNGRALTRGPDYSIQYDFGTVTLLSPEAMDPNAKVSIDFEYAPFIAIQKKSLFGVRGEYSFSNDFRIGSTILYKSDKAQDRKPRVGQETARMLVTDFDGTFKFYPRILTKALNALPFFATDAASAITIGGEYAQSRPNPNIDNVAYVDDFESALERLNMPIGRAQWTLSSVPGQLNQSFRRGNLLWHNPVGGVNTREVYDREVDAREEGRLNTLRLIYKPRSHAISVTTDSSVTPPVAVIDSTPANSWGGVMTYFVGIDQYRVQLFEVRLRGDRGKLHFDFGRISEDIDGDGTPDSEDGLVTGGLKNYVLEEEEDLGLDGIPDELEIDEYGRGHNPVTNPDPAGDNWYSQGEGKCPLPNNGCFDNQFNDYNHPGYYDFMNGTEGNIKDLVNLAIPDEEILNRNAGFQKQNSYFSYVLNLSDTTSDSSFYVSPTNLYGWKTFRIPIRDSLALDTAFVDASNIQPNWGQITHVRVWFEADSTQAVADTVEVAAWYFVQSNWQDSLITRPSRADSAKLVVASVSEDEGTFTPPPGVEAYEDKTNNVTEAQKGLALVYSNLAVGDTALAVKTLPSVDRFSGYGSFEMYVHGAETAGNSGDSVMFLFRIGRDEKAYYEYRTPVYPGWDTRNFVKIDFNEITAVKDQLLKALPKGTAPDKIDSVVGQYRIKGNPNINEIKYFAAGVINMDSTRPAEGQIWLDESRVTDVRRDVGNAARLEVMGNLADLGSFNIQWGQRNPYFRGISATTRGGGFDNLGSGSSENDVSWSLGLTLDKFLPRSLGASLPFNYSYSRSTRLPLLRTGTDIVLPEEIRVLERSLATTRTFRIGEQFRRQGNNPLFSWFLNRQQLNFSYSRNNRTDVNQPYFFSENYNVQAQFDMSVQKPPTLRPVSWLKGVPLLKRLAGTEIGLYPNRWNWSGSFNRNFSVSEDINFRRTYTLQRDFDARVDYEQKVLQNLSVRFGMTTRNDLTNPDLVNVAFKEFRLGQQINYTQTFGMTYDPKLVSWLGTGISYQANYSDNWDRSLKTRKSELSRNWTLGGSFQHIAFLSPGQKGQGASSSQTGRTPNRSRTTNQKAAEKKQGKPFYDPPFAVLRFLTRWVEPVQYRYSETFSNSLPGMVQRPGWQYRLGFDESADVTTVKESRTQFSARGEALDLTSGFKLLGGISTKVGYKRSETRDVIRVGNLGRRVSTQFPDLQITITKFKTLPLIKGPINKLIDIFAPRTGYSRDVAEEHNATAGFMTSKIESKNFNPLIGVNFKLFRSLSLSTSFQKSEQRAERFNPTNGDIQTDTRGTQRSITVTSRYSFRAPGGFTLPLFGKVKVTSTMNIELNVRKSTSESETSNDGIQFIKADSKSDLMISPVISYDFSQQLKGGITAQWQDTKDIQRTSHIRMLQIWAEIRF